MEVAENFINTEFILFTINITGEIFREEWHKPQVPEDMIPMKVTDTDMG